jgi:hypothetical protein
MINLIFKSYRNACAQMNLEMNMFVEMPFLME